MRKAALKLLLSVINEVLQSQSEGLLCNEDWKEIFSALQESATTDTEDPEVKMLANRYLQVLATPAGTSR